MSTNLTAAVGVIDAELGAGYAIEHPELIGALVVAMAIGDVAQMVESNGVALIDIFHAIGELADAGKGKKRP